MNFYATFEINPENFLNNRAMAYGDGLFETMLVMNGSIPLWGFHKQRLQTDLTRLGLNKIKETEVYHKILSLCPNHGEFIAKLVVFRSTTHRGYQGNTKNNQWYISISKNQASLNKLKINFSKITLSRQKHLTGIKHLNRLEQVLAANALINSKYNDAIMLDRKNNIIETISKNIVLIKNNQLFTPELNKCGVYGVALRWLEANNFHLTWKNINQKDLSTFDGLLLCNSITGFREVRNIKKQFHFEQNIPIIADIKKKWFESINSV